METQEIKNRIIVISTSKNIRLIDLANFLNITRQSLNNIFNAKSLKLSFIIKVAQFLEVDITYLITGELHDMNNKAIEEHEERQGNIHIAKTVDKVIEQGASINTIHDADKFAWLLRNADTLYDNRNQLFTKLNLL